MVKITVHRCLAVGHVCGVWLQRAVAGYNLFPPKFVFSHASPYVISFINNFVQYIITLFGEPSCPTVHPPIVYLKILDS